METIKAAIHEAVHYNRLPYFSGDAWVLIFAAAVGFFIGVSLAL